MYIFIIRVYLLIERIRFQVQQQQMRGLPPSSPKSNQSFTTDMTLLFILNWHTHTLFNHFMAILAVLSLLLYCGLDCRFGKTERKTPGKFVFEALYTHYLYAKTWTYVRFIVSSLGELAVGQQKNLPLALSVPARTQPIHNWAIVRFRKMFNHKITTLHIVDFFVALYTNIELSHIGEKL